MIIFYSDAFQDPQNKIYPHVIDVLSVEGLRAAVSHDHVCAEFWNYCRAKENFIGSDCLPMDCDNGEHNVRARELSISEWKTPDDVKLAFPDVCFYTVNSKSNMKDIDRPRNATARPRFHVYFPLSKPVENADEYTAMKRRTFEMFPAFDSNARDAARYYNGVENPDVHYFDGDSFLDEFLSQHPKETRETSFSDFDDVYPRNYHESDKARLLDALDAIDPTALSRADWIHVGMALKSENIDCDVWTRWSQRDPDRYHTGECERIWNSFHGAGFTAGTIYYFARDNGWQPHNEKSGCMDWNNAIQYDGYPTKETGKR